MKASFPTKTLALDIGNTRMKVGVFMNDSLVEIFSGIDDSELKAIVTTIAPTWVVASSSGRTDLPELLSGVKNNLIVGPETKVPIINNYGTPKTLGTDRLAAAVGATVLFPEQNCLIISLGTCITYDFVTAKNTFEGGLISPGLRMRARAMHEFTKRLPLIDVPDHFPDFVGKNTTHAIQSGLLYGILGEIEGVIQRYEAQVCHIDKVLLAGGDAKVFESQLKKPIFASPNLVLLGLYRILQHYVS